MAVDQKAFIYGNDFDLNKNTVFDDLKLYSEVHGDFDDAFEKDTEWYFIPDSYEKTFSVSIRVGSVESSYGKEMNGCEEND